VEEQRRALAHAGGAAAATRGAERRKTTPLTCGPGASATRGRRRRPGCWAEVGRGGCRVGPERGKEKREAEGGSRAGWADLGPS